MQPTPQQLSGGSKFSSKTLIGNWYEEVAVNEAKLQDFKLKSTAGDSGLRKLQSKLAKCTVRVRYMLSNMSDFENYF